MERRVPLGVRPEVPDGQYKRLPSATLIERRGGSFAYTNHIGVHGMQAQELQPDKGKEESSREDGSQEILSVLQEACDAQGNKITDDEREISWQVNRRFQRPGPGGMVSRANGERSSGRQKRIWLRRPSRFRLFLLSSESSSRSWIS